ncbi:MAG: hypothetical protein ABFS17_04440 [Chloroflexota bacterium]
MEAAKDLQVLPDGRQVRRDAQGRYRDVGTGRWLAAAEVDPVSPSGALPQTPRTLIEEAVSQAVRNQGYPVETFDQAVGRLIQVQAEIALDKDDPAKATSAARLLEKLTGLFSEVDAEEDSQKPWFVLGRELAVEVLALVEEEQARREDGE